VVSEVKTPDASTVEFHLHHPYPAFRHSLTQSIVPKSVRDENPDRFGKAPDATVGSGPYEPHLVKSGKYASLRSWDDYWAEPKPAVDRLQVINTHAGLARTTALKTGQSDVVERIEPKLWQATKQIPSAEVTKVPSYNSFFVGFNCSSGPTADPTVREAVDYLLSMDSFAKHIVEPVGERQHSPLPGRLAREWDMPLEEWKGMGARKNLDEAKALFEEAGVKSWTPKVAVPHNDKMRSKLAQGLVRGLSSVGFTKARVKKHHWSEFREHVTSGNDSEYNMYIGSWAGHPDPDSFLYPLFHQRMEGLTNGTYYRNPEVMDAIERARETRAREERKRLYERAITTILEERPHIPAFTLHNSFGVKDRVEGFQPHPLAQMNPQLLTGQGPVSIR
jgi:peptide/nickel transport system substrate-binding protein